MSINEKLKEIYQPYLKNLIINTQEFSEDFSCPILMKVHPDIEKVRKRILYVGRETNEWMGTMSDTNNLSVDYLMDGYEEFEFAKDYYGRNSPFWRFIKAVHESINGIDYPNGILWTNFSKCDSKGTTPSPDLQKLNEIGFDLLKDEINILTPDVIIFLTGWSYENQFQRVFKGIKYEVIEENFLYKCIHESFSNKTFMTMHPMGLNFRKKLNPMISQICNLI
jgi:hypothetical protein